MFGFSVRGTSSRGTILAQEGAVEAVLKLCKTDHLILRGYCSAILKQFAATPFLREKLVIRGGVSKDWMSSVFFFHSRSFF